jgi:hypothetical protein
MSSQLRELLNEKLAAGTPWTAFEGFVELLANASSGGVGVSWPLGNAFMRSGEIIVENGGICGDPQIFWDEDNSRYVMYYFTTSPELCCASMTADNLEGPWSPGVAFLPGYHKPSLLLDPNGVPVKINGLYHIYVSSYPTKDIYVATCEDLQGPFTLIEPPVLVRGDSGIDQTGVDTPSALFYNGHIYLFYMAFPTDEDATYGYASRIALATSTIPTSGFEKLGAVLNPSTNSGDWDYGWLGGSNVRRIGLKWVNVYNGAAERPSGGSGDEPDGSQIGFATADYPIGPWTKSSYNPYISLSDSGFESVNVWRPFLVLDPTTRRWLIAYNAGSGVEKITFARQADFYERYREATPGEITLEDSSGNGADLTNNGVTVGQFGAYFTSGAYLNGSDEFLPDADEPRTLSIRIRPTSALPASPSNRSFLAYGTQNDENAQVLSADSSHVQYAGWADDFPFSEALSVNTWYSVIATFDGTTCEVFIDGVSIGSDTPVAWDTIHFGLCIGANLDSNPDTAWQGYLKDVRVYDRVLNGTEITNLAANTAVPISGLVGEWILFNS